VPGALLAILVFLGGSSALRSYIHFILDHNHAYTALAAPIAALLFFFVLALGVLLGAEFNAALEERWPSAPRRPRLLHRGWRHLETGSTEDDGEHPAAESDHVSPPRALVRRLALRRPASADRGGQSRMAS
jgi:membrane protein